MGSVISMRRHGDQMIKHQNGFQIPTDIDLKPISILHKGDTHDHIIKSGKALLGVNDDKRYLRVVEEVTLDHPEHGQGNVPVGDYWVETKLEYDHLESESREVVD